MIFLVDDDTDDLEIMQEALYENSYKGPVVTHLNGQLLINNLKKAAVIPQVILLDINMPLKDGFETLREIKSDPDLSHIPVIVVTASSRKDDEIRCMELGCSYYFNKPHRMAEYSSLVHLVKKFLPSNL